jgi:hypothetical protein
LTALPVACRRNLDFHDRKGGFMREVHALCVKISRGQLRQIELLSGFSSFFSVSEKQVVGILVGIGIA